MSLAIDTPGDVAQLIGLAIVLPAIVLPAIDPEPTPSSAMPPAPTASYRRTSSRR